MTPEQLENRVAELEDDVKEMASKLLERVTEVRALRAEIVEMSGSLRVSRMSVTSLREKLENSSKAAGSNVIGWRLYSITGRLPFYLSSTDILDYGALVKACNAQPDVMATMVPEGTVHEGYIVISEDKLS